MDRMKEAERSRNMANIRSRDTKPERMVRSQLHSLGLRFRLHRRDLPGTPDILLPKYRLAVFVHGCFWHRHTGCRYASNPKTRVEFWTRKFESNVARDRRVRRQLQRLGWKVAVIWECEASSKRVILRRLGIRAENTYRSA